MFVGRGKAIAVFAVLVAACIAVFGLVAVRSRTADCASAPPVPALSPALKALGGFDQPLSAGRVGQLDDAAQRAAAATGIDLLGTETGKPVPVRALDPATHDALVVPLAGRPDGAGGHRIVGLVAFLTDCGGRASFAGVRDLAHNSVLSALPTGFPRVERDDASQQLGGSGDLQLVYRVSPFEPEWRRASSGPSIPAGGT